jgi:hypothetical protein
VRPVDDVFVRCLTEEMITNPTKDVAPMIGLLCLPEGEVFDKEDPEAYMYCFLPRVFLMST